jgi:hypothetical protein
MMLDEDAQKTLLTLAAPLHPKQREHFFQRVASEPASLPMIGPGIVYKVAREAQKALLDPPALPASGPGSKYSD